MRPILVVWVTRVVCDMDKGTICDFGNASAPEVVEVESETALFSEAVSFLNSRSLKNRTNNVYNV